MIRQWSLVRQQKMHVSQKCCGELAELTVDDIWQIVDAGGQELRRLAHTSRRGTMELGGEYEVGLSQQACTSQCKSSCISRDRPRSYFPVPVTRRAAAFWTCCNLSMTFFGAEDKTELQESTRDVTKAWTNVFTDLMSSERWTRLSCQSQKKHVLQAFETCLSSTAIWVVSSLHKIRNEIRHRTGLRILGLTETAGI